MRRSDRQLRTNSGRKPYTNIISLTQDLKKSVLIYVQGYFRHQLTSRQRGKLVDEILHYRDGLLVILVPLTLMKHSLDEYPDPYLMIQNYFSTYPENLCLRMTISE